MYVLEQIDISLVGNHRHPAIEPEPMISEAPILPILESIVFCYRWLFIKIHAGTKEVAYRSTVIVRFVDDMISTKVQSTIFK